MKSYIYFVLLALITTFSAFGQTTTGLPAPSVASGGAVAQSCVGNPGNTTGKYLSQCQASTGAVYACNNSAGCSVAADWAGNFDFIYGTNNITALEIVNSPQPLLNTWLGAVANANNAITNAVVIGDSTSVLCGQGTGPANCSDLGINVLSSALGASHGVGLIPIGNSPALQNINWTLAGTWTTISDFGPTQPGTGAFNSVYSTTGTGNTLTLTAQQMDTVVFYGETNSGSSSCTLSVDGGTQTITIPETATGTPTPIEVSTAITAGLGSHTIEVIGPASGNCLVYGVQPSIGTTGIAVHNLAHGYARSEAWGTSTAAQLAYVPLIPGGVQLAIVALGINDSINGTGVTPTQYQTNMQAIITYLLAYNPQMSILIMDENPTSAGYSGTPLTQTQIKAIETSLALTNNVAFASLQDRFVSYANLVALGWMSGGDHLNNAGQLAVGQYYTELLGIPGTNAVTLAGTQTFTGAKTFPPSGLISYGTTTTDSGNLGVELTTSGTTTSTGWTGTYNSFSNGASNTSPLTYAPTISSGTLYQVVITVSGYSAGSISITFGGVALATMSSNTTQTIGPRTTSTAGLIITPTSTFVGTVTASIKAITAISTYAFLGKDSTGANSVIILQPLASLNNYFGGGGGTYNTTGSRNSAQGVNALYNNTTGSYNSAQGQGALYSNTTGSGDSAQGLDALYSNTTGANNSAQGVNALYNNTTAGNNSAQGQGALYNNTTGGNNSAQGQSALYSNTTGSGDSAQGFQAGYGTSATNANTTGSFNSFYGYEAAPGSSTQQQYMTVIGASATCANSYAICLGRKGTAANGSDVVIYSGQFTVSSGTGFPALPSAASYPQACGWVTDALTVPTYLGTATGGGTTLALVCSNGTNWQYH